MKRRSFLTLALSCLGIKLTPKIDPEDQPVESWIDIRMDEADDTSRQWLADQLWYETRATKFDL